MGTTAATVTFEEFERLPDQPGKRELLKGELIELPPAESRHNRIAYRLSKLLDAVVTDAHARGAAKELGETCMEMGYRLGENNWVQPDVSMTQAGQTEGKYLEGAPAIAIEVISPSNTAEQMDAKTVVYFECGALEIWRIYPKTRHVMVHTETGIRVLREHETVTSPLLPSLALPVNEILAG